MVNRDNFQILKYMENNLSLAEMVSTADYSAMTYDQLVEYTKTSQGLHPDVKSLIDIKRDNEMKATTLDFVTKRRTLFKEFFENKDNLKREYEARMKHYKADVAEMTGFLMDADFVPDEAIFINPQPMDDSDSKRENPAAPSGSMGGLDDTDLWEYNEKLAGMTDGETADTDSADSSEVNTTPDSKEKSPTEQAVEMTKNRQIPGNIDTGYPYYVTHIYKTNSHEGFHHDSVFGNNVSIKTLNAMKENNPAYARLFHKGTDMVATDDILAYKKKDGSVSVTFYHIPEDGTDYNEEEMSLETAVLCTDEETAKELKKSQDKKRRKIMKFLKELEDKNSSDESEACFSFYEIGYCRRLENKDSSKVGDPHMTRCFEDVDDLPEMKKVFETHGKLHLDYEIMVSTTNSVAFDTGTNIHVFSYHLPSFEAKWRNSSMTNDSTTPVENAPTPEVSKVNEPTADTVIVSSPEEMEIIKKGYELARSFVTNQVSKSFSQHSFSISNEGNVIYTGQSFTHSVDDSMFDDLKRRHVRYAKTMNASAIISNDNYTACVCKGGKSLNVYVYNK